MPTYDKPSPGHGHWPALSRTLLFVKLANLRVLEAMVEEQLVLSEYPPETSGRGKAENKRTQFLPRPKKPF